MREAEKALAAIEERLSLIYRLCCGTAPKQAIGELVAVMQTMPEWSVVRAQLAAPDPTLLVKIRNVALEEAAKVCDDTDVVEGPCHQAMYCQLGDASATRGAIAAAIRERILDAAPQGEGA